MQFEFEACLLGLQAHRRGTVPLRDWTLACAQRRRR